VSVSSGARWTCWVFLLSMGLCFANLGFIPFFDQFGLHVVIFLGKGGGGGIFEPFWLISVRLKRIEEDFNLYRI
jgi:hypothetical protein